MLKAISCARFIIYDLATIFANVPIIDKPLGTVDKENIVKSNFADVMAFILSDLDKAINSRR